MARQCWLAAGEELIENPAKGIQICTGVRRIIEQLRSGIALGRRRTTVIRGLLIDGHRPIEITQVCLTAFV